MGELTLIVCSAGSAVLLMGVLATGILSALDRSDSSGATTPAGEACP